MMLIIQQIHVKHTFFARLKKEWYLPKNAWPLVKRANIKTSTTEGHFPVSSLSENNDMPNKCTYIPYIYAFLNGPKRSLLSTTFFHLTDVQTMHLMSM